MPVNPSITKYTPAEGETKTLPNGTVLRLSPTGKGVRRWINADKDKESAGGGSGMNQGPASAGDGSAAPSGAGEPPPIGSLTKKELEDAVQGNAFVVCDTLEDIDNLWFEEMQKVKSDKLWYEQEVEKLKIKLKLASTNAAREELTHNIKRFQKVINDTDRESMVNYQRVLYEFYRLQMTVNKIQESNPAFNYQEFLQSEGTLEELESMAKGEEANV